jgi:hypothetical protein
MRWDGGVGISGRKRKKKVFVFRSDFHCTTISPGPTQQPIGNFQNFILFLHHRKLPIGNNEVGSGMTYKGRGMTVIIVYIVANILLDDKYRRIR